MKLWRGLIALTLAFAAPAMAQDLGQDAPPMPAPLPAFHAPVVDDGGTSDLGFGQPSDVAIAPDLPSAEPAAPAVPAEPQPVTLTALVTDGGRPISQGLVWRVYNTKLDASGQLVLAAKSEAAVAELKLVPGDYVVDVAYGRAQASEGLSVKAGRNQKSLVLDAGGLRLNAAITGDVAIPINLLRFDVLAGGQSDADRTVVGQNLAANDIVTLSAGTYHVVSYFGDVNAVVRADLKVEPGQLTDATLYHKAAQVSFKLVSEAGGEAIAGVDWTVKTADGATVMTNSSTFPATVLQEGDYVVLAKRGEQVYNRDFQVQPGQPKEIEVLTTVY